MRLVRGLGMQAGNSAAHLAVELGLPEVLAELMEFNANLDLQNKVILCSR